jgi:predicted TPR repeat methyltransferase
MGHVYLDIGDHEKALVAFERGVEQDGDNFSRHMLNALSTQNKMRNGEIIEEEKAPAAYIAELFDQYALHFDNHLLESLHYKGPQLIRALLDKLYLTQTAKLELVLDLGCGTGLMGEVLQSRCEQLWGIDLSKNMLVVAESKKIYQQLVCADVVEFLRSTLVAEEKQADLIVAFDVCNYFGDLKPLLQAVHARLKSGGIVIFSTERLDDLLSNPSQLQTTGRYSHSQAYILQLADQLGFRLKSVEQNTLRTELGQAVEGNIFILSVV